MYTEIYIGIPTRWFLHKHCSIEVIYQKIMLKTMIYNLKQCFVENLQYDTG